MVAWIQGTSADAGSVTSTSLTYPGAVTAGSALVTGARYGSGTDNFTSISDSVNGAWAAALINQLEGGAGADRLYADVLKNTGAGTPTVTITFSSAATVRWGIGEYGPCDTTAAVDQPASHADTGISNPSSGTITTLNANDVLIAMLEESSGAATITDDTGFTNRFDVGPNKFNWSDKVVSATGTYSSTWSLSANDDTAGCIIALKAPSAGGIHFTGAETLGNFTSAGAFANLDHWTAAQTLGPFLSLGRFTNGAGPSNIQLISRRARRPNQPLGFV